MSKDEKAMHQLASELPTPKEAARFIREELDCGLTDAIKHIMRIKKDYPNSPLSFALDTGSRL